MFKDVSGTELVWYRYWIEGGRGTSTKRESYELNYKLGDDWSEDDMEVEVSDYWEKQKLHNEFTFGWEPVDKPPLDVMKNMLTAADRNIESMIFHRRELFMFYEEQYDVK